MIRERERIKMVEDFMIPVFVVVCSGEKGQKSLNRKSFA